MGMTAPAVEKVSFKCEHPGCTTVWTNVSAKRAPNLRQMHDAKFHTEGKSGPKGHRLPRVTSDPKPNDLSRATKAGIVRTATEIRDGRLSPEQRLTNPMVRERTGLGIYAANQVLEALASQGLLTKRHFADKAYYHVSSALPGNPQPVASGSLAEAKASVALDKGDGQTQSIASAEVSHPQLDSALSLADAIANYLREELATGKYPVGSTLPTQTEFARVLGVRQGSVSQGMKTLQGEGVLKSVLGEGVKVLALPIPSPSPEPLNPQEPTFPDASILEPLKSKRQKVTEYLRDAILRGDFQPHETLPSRDVLAVNMNVGHATVSAAYERLVGEGLVESRGRMGVAVLPREQWQVSTKPTAPPQVRPIEPHLTPSSDPDDLIPAGDVMPIIKVLYDETRRAWNAEAEAKKSDTEVTQLRRKVEELEAKLRGSAFEFAELEGKFRKLDEQDAELRLQLHKRNGHKDRVIRSFGPEFKNTLNMSDTDAERIKGLLKTKKLMEAAPGYER